MPKKIDPTTISVSGKGEGVSPSEILKTQINRERDAYNSSQISNYSSIPDKFFDGDLESNLNDLTGAMPKRPPTLGEESIVFDNGTLSGVTDWGMLKQADSSIHTRRASFSSGTYGGLPSTLVKNDPKDSYPYYLDSMPSGEDPRTDSIFNVEDINNMYPDNLSGAGGGRSNLATIFHNSDLKACRSIKHEEFNNFGANKGFTISGFLFPADRGTVALLHWDAHQTDFLDPATTREEIMNRVIGAINLGQGIESGNDGKAGGEIFIEGNQSSPDPSEFPSRLGGQYDLGEMQRATYRSDDPTRSGNAIPNLSANAHLGSVRLLRDERAVSFTPSTHPSGNLPVLFGTEMWNFDTSSYDNNNANATNKDKNFLAYRMPYLSSYSPDDLEIDKIERARFFKAITPSSQTIFDSAGNYFGFESDAHTYQIARYRYSVDFKQIKAGLSSSYSDMENQTTPSLNIGSFALIHFKTESAFESLVRDGVVPSEDDLWSYTLYDYDEAGGERNMIEREGEFDSKGISKSDTEEWIDSLSDNLIKPTNVIHNYDSKFSNDLEYSSKTTNVLGWNIASTIYSTTAYGFNQRYIYMSGIPYALPLSQRYYDTSFYNIDSDPTINKCSMVFSFNIDDLSPVMDGNNEKVFWSTPFYSFKDQQGDSVVRKNTQGTTGDISRDQFHTFNFAPYSFSTKDLSSNDRVHFVDTSVSIYVTLLNTPSKGLVQIDYDSLISQQFTYDPLDENSPVDSYIYRFSPLGDSSTDNFPTFSDDLRLTTYAHNPTYHLNGTSIEKVVVDNVNQSHRFNFHSAYCKSLIKGASTTTVDVAIRYSDLATRSNHELAFILYRVEQDRIICQELELHNGELELCTDGVNPVGGTYDDNLPVYRVVNDGYTNIGVVKTFSFEGVLNDSTKVATQLNSINFTTSKGNTYNQKVWLYDSYIIEFINASTLPNATVFEINVDCGSGFQGWTDMTSTPASGIRPYGFDLKDDGTVDHFNDGTSGAFYTYAFNESVPLKPYAIEIKSSEDTLSISEYGNFTESENGVISTFNYGSEQPPADVLNSYPPFKPYSAGFTARKDVQERFLDEMYRVDGAWTGWDVVAYNYDAGGGATDYDEKYLLQNGNIRGTDYDFSHLVVRDDKAIFSSLNPITLQEPPHKGAGWVRGHYHVMDLSTSTTPELQVRPLPYSEDAHPLRTKINVGRGRLDIPSHDYSSYTPLHRPGPFDGFVNPDYSSGNSTVYNPQTDNDLYTYTRLFDLKFKRSGSLETLSSYNFSKQFKIRIVGLHLQDLNEKVNLGSPTSDDKPISVLVMVPGVTGWLNVARENESDESKKTGNANILANSSVGEEGVGCRVAYEDKVIKSEAVRCVDITCDISPHSFFENNDFEIPLLVRVVIQKSTLWGINYNFAEGVGLENVPQILRKGIIGIDILRPSNGMNFDQDEVLPYSDY